MTWRIAVSNISKNSLLASIGGFDGDGYSGLTEWCDQHTTISIVVISGQREAMLGTLQQLVLGGSLNIHNEILASDDESAAQPNEKKLGSDRCQPSASNLGLTERQLDVLALMMQGKSNKAICRVLDLAESTVKNHVTAVLRALKVSNRTEAVVAVSELGRKLPVHRNSICNRESHAYEDDAVQTAAKQLAKAGMRLALVLNDALQ
jgi:DNA-binding NarL/FixJ family response regulator